MVDREGGAGSAPGEIIFEFIAMGAMVRVAAVDVATGVEVTIIGSARSPRFELEAAARRKLGWVLNKKKKEPAVTRPAGPGIVV